MTDRCRSVILVLQISELHCTVGQVCFVTSWHPEWEFVRKRLSVLHNFSGFVELLHNVIWQRKF